MKRSIIQFIILITFLSGCKKSSSEATLTGEIKGLGNDTIYLYGNDELSDFIDTIYIINDKFSHTIPMDTLSQAMLLIGGEESYPVYLDKGSKINIKGDFTNAPGFLQIQGNALNEEFTAYSKSLQELPEQSDSLLKIKAEEYINQHYSSLLCIYLLDKYFVQSNEPDLPKIKELISSMDGRLQDKPYIQKLSETIEQSEKSEINKTAPSFSLPNQEKKNISRYDFRDKYLLITFWASWCDSCQTSNAELKKISKTYIKKSKNSSKTKQSKEKEKKEGLAILGISLDLDKASWLDAIKKDTLNWEQVCDFSGWSSTTIKQYGVFDIPYNILIDTKGRIIARGIKGEELTGELKRLLNPENK